MIKLAAVMFAVAALGGLALATLHFKKKALPIPLALLHGLLGAAGLVSLLLALLGTGFSGAPAIAFAIFVVAACGGFLLFSFHLRKRVLPNALVIIHGLAAVVVLPLLYSLGATDDDDEIRFEFEGIQNGSISMRTISFGAKRK